MTSAQPYRGRHSAPDDVEAPEPHATKPATPAPVPAPRPDARTPALLAAPWSAFAGSVPTPPAVTPAPVLAPLARAADAEPEWVVYTPPSVPEFFEQPEVDPQPPIWESPGGTVALAPVAERCPWEMPAGFVPLQPPRTKSPAVKYVAVAAAVAVVAALGWFGYQAVAQTNPSSPFSAAPPAISAADVDFTSPDGHFTVGLPAQPITTTVRVTHGGFTFVESLSDVPSANEVVGEMTVTPSIPADRMDEFLHGGIAGFAHGHDLSAVTSTTFQGKPAVTATSPGADFPAMILVGYSSTRVYVLGTSDDSDLNALESRFRPTP